MHIYTIRTLDGYLVEDFPVYLPEQASCKKQAQKALQELQKELGIALSLGLEQITLDDDPR